MTDQQLRLTRRFATWTFLKVAVGSAVAWTLIRVVVPDFIDAHDDVLAALGVLSALVTPVIVGWLAVSLILSTRRFLGEIGKNQ